MTLFSVLFFVLVRGASAFAASECAPFYGEVRHQKTDQLVYRVSYTFDCPARGPKSVKTVFDDPNGKELAHQTETESNWPYIFNTTFDDLRNGDHFEISVTKKNGKDIAEIVSKDGRTGKTKTKTFHDLDHLMSRSGAVEFIRDHLKQLADGKVLKARFLVVSRLDAYSVRYRGKLIENGNRLSVSIELTNPFYRLFAPSMSLIYDMHENTLVQFQGNGSLLDVNGKPIPVDVAYHQGTPVDAGSLAHQISR